MSNGPNYDEMATKHLAALEKYSTPVLNNEVLENVCMLNGEGLVVTELDDHEIVKGVLGCQPKPTQALQAELAASGIIFNPAPEPAVKIDPSPKPGPDLGNG